MQLVGLVLLGIGVALRFSSSPRAWPWRVLAIAGAAIALIGAVLSPGWQTLWQGQDPSAYLGLVVGVAAPFLLALVLTLGWRWAANRKRKS